MNKITRISCGWLDPSYNFNLLHELIINFDTITNDIFNGDHTKEEKIDELEDIQDNIYINNISNNTALHELIPPVDIYCTKIIDMIEKIKN